MEGSRGPLFEALAEFGPRLEQAGEAVFPTSSQGTIYMEGKNHVPRKRYKKLANQHS